MIVFTLLLSALAAPPAGIPENYRLVYETKFDSPDVMKDFAFPDPKAWRLTEAGGQMVLEQHANAKYKPPHRSPGNFCLLATKSVGDFVLEVEGEQTSKEYGHRDMVFVFGYQGPAKYYYTHIATKGDDHANNIFIVNDAPRTKISTTTNAGNDWGPPGTYRKVRIQRQGGEISVYFDDMTKPIMTAKSNVHGAGHVGFGTFDDTCRVRAVRLWSPDARDAAPPIFAKGK